MELDLDNQIISQGAEAKIYLSYFHGKKCIVKERFVKSYRVPELDNKLTKQRLLNESRNLAKLNKIGLNTPYILFVDVLNRKIYMEYIEESCMLKNVLKKIYETNDFSTIYGTLIEKIIETLAFDLAKLHNNSVIHGDLTTSNLLLVNHGSYDNAENDILQEKNYTCMYFIDLGLSFISVHSEDKAVDLFVFKRALISSNPKSELLVSFFI